MLNIAVTTSAKGKAIQIPFTPNNLGKVYNPTITKIILLDIQIKFDGLESSIA